MEQRTLGGFPVSVLGLGTSRLASLGAGRSKADANTLLATARDCGINVIDTADTYGSTAAERWIGDLTAEDRDYWVVVTKTGLPTVDLPGPFRVLNQPAKKLKQRVEPGFALDHRSLKSRVQRSLKRLRRERIEFYLLHLPPIEIVNSDETRDILQELRQSGHVAEFGVSSDELHTVRAARAVWGSRCAETAVNRWSLSRLEREPLADIELIANHVMGDLRSNPPPLASPEGGVRPFVSKPQRMLRHAAAIPGVKVVLTGTSSPIHLRQNAAAFEVGFSDLDPIE